MPRRPALVVLWHCVVVLWFGMHAGQIVSQFAFVHVLYRPRPILNYKYELKARSQTKVEHQSKGGGGGGGGGGGSSDTVPS